MEAGFMRIVEVGQYFITKDTGDFRQFRSVACREYTLPRDDGEGDGVPKAGRQQAAADSRGSRTCVCANTFGRGVAHAGEEGRINVLPWYRLVGVAKTSRRKGGRARLPARVTTVPHLP